MGVASTLYYWVSIQHDTNCNGQETYVHCNIRIRKVLPLSPPSLSLSYLPTLSNPLSGSDRFMKLAFFFNSREDGDFHSFNSAFAWEIVSKTDSYKNRNITLAGESGPAKAWLTRGEVVMPGLDSWSSCVWNEEGMSSRIHGLPRLAGEELSADLITGT